MLYFLSGRVSAYSIFNPETVNFFTDSSYINNKGGAYAAIAVYNNQIMRKDVRSCGAMYTTNNVLELKAIRLAVGMAYTIANIPYINIFSDSQYAVNSLRQYVKNWSWNSEVNAYTKPNEKYPIPNQELIVEILRMIYRFMGERPGVSINIIYTPGHVGKDYKSAKDKFAKSNIWNYGNYINKTDLIDTGLIQMLGLCNDRVDNLARDSAKRYNGKVVTEPIIPDYRPKSARERRKDYENE